MSTNLSPVGGAAAQFLDNNGNPLTGGKLYTYDAGTTTPQATYTTSTGNVAHANPIILDSAGRVPGGEIWLTPSLDYKFTLTTSADVLIATWDNIVGINGTGLATNANVVAYDPAGSDAVQRTVESKLRESVSVKDFGAVGDNVTDDTAAFQAAIDYANSVWVGGSQLGGGVTIYIPAGRYKLGALIYKNGANLQGAGKQHSQLRVFGNNTTLFAATSNTSTQTSASNLFYGSWKDFAILSWEGANSSTPTGQVGWDAVGFSRWYCENIYFGWGAGFVGIRMTDAILAGSGGPSNWYNTFVGCFCEKHYLGSGGVGLLLGDTSSTKEQITTWNWIGGAIRGSGDGTGTGLNLQSGTGCTFYGVTFEAVQNAVLLGSSAGTRFANNVDFIGCYWEGNTVNWNVYAGCVNNGFIGGFVTGGTGTDNGSYTRFSIPGATKSHIQGSSSDDYWQVRMINGGVKRPQFIAGSVLSGFDIVDDVANVATIYSVPQTSSAFNYLNAYGNNLADPIWEAGTSAFSPGDDDVKSLGRAAYKWSVVYAATGAINTSDEREKQDVAALDEAEKRVAVALKGLIKKFRFRDAVSKKGEAARTHVGVIAQEVAQAFQAEGLDPMRYGVVCYDEWESEPAITAPVLDAGGKETGEVRIIREARPAGNRYGVRYEELLAFMIAAI